jgi:hypothetical protein
MTDASAPWRPAPINSDEITGIDQMLQAAQLLRQNEQARARDRSGVLAGRLDPEGERLDAYSLGLLDGVRTIAGGDVGFLRLLAYLLVLCEIGPGPAPEAADRMVRLAHDENLSRYVDLGRQTVFDIFVGEGTESEQFALLLLSETSADTAH